MKTFPTIEQIAEYAHKRGANYDDIVFMLNSKQDGKTIYDWVKIVAPKVTAKKALEVAYSLYIHESDI